MQKVLIIDDSKLVGARLTEILSGIKSVQVLGQAKSAREGLALSEKFSPDIVFLDIQLPDGNGTSILPALKKIKPGINVVILSNFDADLHRPLFPVLEGDYYLD